MPAKVRKRGNKFRVVESNKPTRLTRNRKGTPVDGGGHRTRKKAERQARAINQSLR